MERLDLDSAPSDEPQPGLRASPLPSRIPSRSWSLLSVEARGDAHPARHRKTYSAICVFASALTSRRKPVRSGVTDLSADRETAASKNLPAAATWSASGKSSVP
jgi:hypothetical protein